MHDGVGGPRRELSGGPVLRTDDIRRVAETERSGQAQELADPMAVGFSRHRNMVHVLLPPRSRFARMRHQPDSATRCHQGEKGGAVTRLCRNSKIVSPP